MTKKNWLRKAVSAPLLPLAILGCVLLMAGSTSEGGPDSVTPVPTPLAFQPDILDKPIINAPAGKEGAPPFLFEFDTGNSSGFEEIRTDRPGSADTHSGIECISNPPDHRLLGGRYRC